MLKSLASMCESSASQFLKKNTTEIRSGPDAFQGVKEGDNLLN